MDTHCHLFLLDRDPVDTLEAARAAGVRTLVCVGIDPESSRRCVEISEALGDVYATAGMHPHTAADLDASAAGEIEVLLPNPQVVAVGETGLDFFRMLSPREDQERSLRLHVALSRASGKPLVVHVRDAWDDVLRVLEEERAERVVLHCFSADASVALECAARGYFMSFAGNLTYPRNDSLREAAAAVPPGRLLAETDSPFLAPQPLRGRDNAPENITIVLSELARVRGEPLEEVAATVATNARAAFVGLD